MTQTIVGVLAIDPHRLHVYWEAPRSLRGRIRMVTCPPVGRPEEIPRAGSRYFENLPPDRTYHVELHCNGQMLARSNTVVLPPESPPAVDAPPTSCDGQ
jgi:hypothetical protein